jgi:ATP synthase protein I
MKNQKSLKLADRIKKFESKNKKPEKREENISGFGFGLKISLDLISPIIVGVCIGLGIDKLFSTKPIFFLIFLLLGIITGFINIFKLMTKLK